MATSPLNGAPTLLNPPAVALGAAPVQLQDAQVSGRKIESVWGIYLAGTNTMLVRPDTILAVDYRHEWRVADFPMEEGAFESYNKVAVPFDVRLRMTKGSTKPLPNATVDPAVSVFGRRDFLKALEAAAASLDLYDVVTPEVGYYGVNIVSVDYRREAANGMSLITVDVGLRQIRLTAVSKIIATQQPSGAAAVNNGTVQTTAPKTQQSTVVKNAIAIAKTAPLPGAAMEAQISSAMQSAGLF